MNAYKKETALYYSCNSRQQQKQFHGVLRIKSLVDVNWFEWPVHKSATQKLQYGQVVKVHKKRVNFFWLTSSVFMDTCKWFYFIFISTFSSILFWSATPLTEMVKSHKHNSRIFNVMEISRFFFCRWWN